MVNPFEGRSRSVGIRSQSTSVRKGRSKDAADLCCSVRLPNKAPGRADCRKDVGYLLLYMTVRRGIVGESSGYFLESYKDISNSPRCSFPVSPGCHVDVFRSTQ